MTARDAGSVCASFIFKPARNLGPRETIVMSATRIPLFPLNVVLFPGQAVPLHIFELRYREMTRHCIDTQSCFGIVFVNDGKMARIGCSALIVKTLKEYEDGRSDILTVGQSAFHLIRTLEEKLYFEGDVHYLEEDFSGADAALSARVEQLCNQCHQVLYGEDAPRFEAQNGSSLAYHVASELPLDAVFRQGLLEVRSEAERQQRLAVRLVEWLPQLQQRDHVRTKAGGNGHGKL
jgi:ATP-dependent Lon protease